MPANLTTGLSSPGTLAPGRMAALYLYPQDTAQSLVHGGGVRSWRSAETATPDK